MLSDELDPLDGLLHPLERRRVEHSHQGPGDLAHQDHAQVANLQIRLDFFSEYSNSCSSYLVLDTFAAES